MDPAAELKDHQLATQDPKLILAKGAPVMVLDPHDIELSGNVSAKFERAASAPF